MSIFILNKKYTKSDIWKTWKEIFISYIKTSKHLRVWAPYTHQILIANKPVVNKSKRDVNLLVEYLLLP